MDIRLKISDDQLALMGETPSDIELEVNKCIIRHINAITETDQHVSKFLDKYAVAKRHGRVKCSELYRQYTSHCTDNHLPYVGRNTFYQIVCSVGQFDLPISRKKKTGNVLIFENLTIVE